MNKKVKAVIIFFTTLWISVASASENEKVLIEYFFQPGCPECDMVDEFIRPQLKEMYAGKYEIKEYDINKPENIPKLVSYQERFDIPDDKADEPVSMVVNKQIFLNGYPEIEKKLLKRIGETLASKRDPAVESTSEKEYSDSLIENRFSSFTLSAVIFAGFIDGINPCVFAALVFFISLLSVSKIRGRKLLIAGSVYCIACFISYLALGFGLFRFLKLFSGYKNIQLIINYTMAVVLLILATISFRDAWWFSKTGKASDIDLQLPDKLKGVVHNVMKKGLSYKHLVPGAFVIGVIVTAIESVCTGQVYVPTLIYLSRQGNIQAFFYLIMYNLAFIVPLIIIFAMAYKGVSTPKLIEWSKKNVTPAKIIMGCFFIAMAILIAIL